MDNNGRRDTQVSNQTMERDIELTDSPTLTTHSFSTMHSLRPKPLSVSGQPHPRGDSFQSPRSPRSPDAIEPAKPAAVWERPDYSDLIVCESQDWDSEKMPVVEAGAMDKVYEGGGSVTLTRTTTLTPASPYLTDPVPEYSAGVQRASTMSQVPLNTKGEYAQWNQGQGKPPPQPPIKDERVFFGVGMSKKRLSLVGVGVLAFILILLATVLGITLTMNIVARHADKPMVTRNHLLLENSGLSAVNWTDSYGNDRAAVFYQDNSTALMVALRDSVSNEWTQSNVTASIMNSTGASRLDIMTASPLAAVANQYQVSLYYLTSRGTIAEIWSRDIVAETWNAGVLAQSLSPLDAQVGSHLSAYWQMCTNCTASVLVTFQDPDGALQIANYTGMDWALATTPDISPINGTGIAIRPFTEDGGTGQFGTDTGGLRLYTFDSTGLVESQANTGENYTWSSITASPAFSSLLATDANPELAAITYGKNGLLNSLVSYLDADGVIQAYMYNGTAWSSGQPEITGGPDPGNYTSIAAGQNAMIYATYNGTIYEFQFDQSDPLIWTQYSTVMVS